MPQTGPWTGDPVWLADVLRAEGVKLVEFPGWRDRGHGDFKDIRGVMVHHTGSDNASAASIAYGRPDLPGPLSQLHIARDGTVTVVAVGVAWHAGVGMYPWLPTNMGNWHMIGIECANSGTSPTAPHPQTGPTRNMTGWFRCWRTRYRSCASCPYWSAATDTCRSGVHATPTATTVAVPSRAMCTRRRAGPACRRRWRRRWRCPIRCGAP